MQVRMCFKLLRGCAGKMCCEDRLYAPCAPVLLQAMGVAATLL